MFHVCFWGVLGLGILNLIPVLLLLFNPLFLGIVVFLGLGIAVEKLSEQKSNPCQCPIVRVGRGDKRR